MKLTFKIITLSISLFLLVSIISFLFYSLKMNNGYKIGFPFVYYSEFQLNNNEYKNFGWFPYQGIYNALICLALAITFFKIKRS